MLLHLTALHFFDAPLAQGLERTTVTAIQSHGQPCPSGVGREKLNRIKTVEICLFSQ